MKKKLIILGLSILIDLYCFKIKKDIMVIGGKIYFI